MKRVQEYLDGAPFLLTYGDGVSDINIEELVRFHRSHGKLVTLTAYNPGQRFGCLDIAEDGLITSFREKTKGDGDLVNAGFMVCESAFLDYIDGDSTVLERTPLERVAREGNLMSYRHTGFWQCMDTVREKQLLETMWAEGKAPWKVW